MPLQYPKKVESDSYLFWFSGLITEQSTAGQMSKPLNVSHLGIIRRQRLENMARKWHDTMERALVRNAGNIPGLWVIRPQVGVGEVLEFSLLACRSDMTSPPDKGTYRK